MVSFGDRRKLRAELNSAGYAIDYLNNWQPKIQMWLHKDRLNTEGDVVQKAGTQIPDQPGNPDHVVRLFHRGVVGRPVTPDCPCLWCNKQREKTGEKRVVALEVGEHDCPFCPWKPKADSKRPDSAQQMHLINCKAGSKAKAVA